MQRSSLYSRECRQNHTQMEIRTICQRWWKKSHTRVNQYGWLTILIDSRRRTVRNPRSCNHCLLRGDKSLLLEDELRLTVYNVFLARPGAFKWQRTDNSACGLIDLLGSCYLADPRIYLNFISTFSINTIILFGRFRYVTVNSAPSNQQDFRV